MAIRYALVKNEAMVGKDRLVARVYSTGTMGREEFVREVSAAGTTVSASDTLAVVANADKVVEDALAAGFNVAIGLGTFSVWIKGTFESYQDRFDPSRHEIVVRFRPSKRLIKALQDRAQLHRLMPHEMRPNPIAFQDVVTGQRDSVMTPGGIGHIYGSRLKFDPSDPKQGIYIMGENRGVLHVRVVAENQPRKLMFLIPLLPAGVYRLAVRAACCGGESVGTGFLSEALTVTGAAPLLEEAEEFTPVGPFLLGS